MADYEYIGSELELFAHATNWKSYLRTQIQPLLGSTVLEVGAGLGGTTRLLCQQAVHRWVCLEPDAALAQHIERAIAGGALPRCCELRIGTLHDVRRGELFDSILYIDVLEHIERDAAELEHAAGYLREGGHLIVLAPAHPSLFTPFDQAIGHYRRYTRESLRKVGPPGLEPGRLDYLDCVGLLASLGNRLLLRSAHPTLRQVRLWDRWMVPLSRRLDPLFRHRLGKSVMGVWSRPRNAPAAQERAA